jgi:hypothetical protein
VAKNLITRIGLPLNCPNHDTLGKKPLQEGIEHQNRGR